MEFKGKRMIALTSKCYYADNAKEKKVSSKGVNKMQNIKSWDDYWNALNGHKDMARNVGFRRDKGKMITYNQKKIWTFCIL